MGHKVLVVVLVAVVLAVLMLSATACGAGHEAPAQASSADAAQPRLLDIGDFSLLPGRATHSLFRATTAHALRIFIIADRPLASVKLRRMANDDGGPATPEPIPLTGSPHDLDGQTVYGLTSKTVEPGYFRLDLRGRGRVQSLAVQDW